MVWISYDQPRKLGDKETGGGLSLPVWIEFMAPGALKEQASIPNWTRRRRAWSIISNEWFYDVQILRQGQGA